MHVHVGLSVQCWFRMLHTLGSPVDLLHQDIITGTQSFQGYISETTPNDVLLQRCVSQLPLIFESVMKGIALQVIKGHLHVYSTPFIHVYVHVHTIHVHLFIHVRMYYIYVLQVHVDLCILFMYCVYIHRYIFSYMLFLCIIMYMYIHIVHYIVVINYMCDISIQVHTQVHCTCVNFKKDMFKLHVYRVCMCGFLYMYMHRLCTCKPHVLCTMYKYIIKLKFTYL